MPWVGNAVSPAHYKSGWHITAICGVSGAVAASAQLLRRDAAQTAHALGIAASQAGGIVENLPNGAKNVGVGNAARNGLFTALLAGQGYTAAPMAIEGKLGWASAAQSCCAISGSVGRSRTTPSSRIPPVL